MKPAKLPGVEKFKFWDKSLLEDDDDEDDDSSSINDNDSLDSGGGGGGGSSVKKLTSKSVTSSPGGGSGDSIDGVGQGAGQGEDNIFIRGYVIRNTCSSLQSSKKSVLCDIIDSTESTEQHHSLPLYQTCHPAACHLVHHHNNHHSNHHYHYRRKVILPISSRLAAKVLTSTDLPLDLFDIRDHYKSTRLRDVVVGMTTSGNLIAGVDTGIVGSKGDGASAGRATLQPKRYININNNNNNNNHIFIHKDTDDNC